MDLDTALSLIIANTQKRKRHCSIVELAEAIENAVSKLSDINELGDLVGISGKMLKQFLKVNEMNSDVINLVKLRKIDSVDVVNTLSLLDRDNQYHLAIAFIENGWSSSEMRSAVEIRIKQDQLSLDQVIKKVEAEKSKKVYIFECIARGGIDEYMITDILKGIDLYPLRSSVIGSKVRVEFTEADYLKFKAVAKSKKTPVSKILPRILY